MGSIQRFSSQPKFVCACLFLLLGQTLASIKQAKKTNNDIANSIINNQNEPEIERIPVVRDSAGDIVIESFDDGLLSASSAKGSNDRHHYEQPATVSVDPQKQSQEPQTQQAAPDQPVAATEAPSASLVVQDVPPAATISSKPEPRNHQEDQQPETVVIDHRPTGSLEQPAAAGATHTAVSSASTGSMQDYSHQSNGNQQPSSAGSGAQPAATAHQVQPSQQQQQHTTGGQPVAGWYSASNYQSGPLQQQPHQFNQQPVAASSLQGSNYGNSMMGSSNQAQHPTSINSIINDPQNQGSLINPVGPQYQAASSQASATLAANPASGQQAATNMMSLNGQPVYFVNPSGQVALGGRRISNWLRGISSMLASIFNRREHGAQLMNGQANSPNGHWIQLGPNAPHWLTQAQSLIQQQQQQFQQQFGTIAGGANNNNPSQQQLIASASTNRYPTFVQAPPAANQQPQQPATLQASAILSGQPQHQQLLSASYPVSVPSSNGDLQASSSSNSYVTVQQPPNQQQSGQTANLAQYQQQPSVGASFGGFQSPSAMPQLVQTQQQQVAASRQSAPAAQLEQPRQSSPSSGSTLAATGNGSQPATVWSPAAPPLQSSAGASQSQARFSRSSSSLASASQNLPLAHYSRYANSEQ